MLLLSVSTGNKLGLGLIGLAVVVFALVCSLVVPRRRPDFPSRNFGGFLLLCVCFFAAMLFAVFYFAKETHEGTEALGEQGTTTIAEGVQTNTGVTATTATTTNETTTNETTTNATTTTATTTNETTTNETETETETESENEGRGSGADLAAGRAVFQGNCAACHTLQDAKTSGTVGPNLDQLAPDESTVEHQVINGGGAMPAFKGTLTDEQIKSVASYVAAVAGKS